MDKISVITVTFNAENILQKTIQSIHQQTYTNTELIVIDGKSTDNTLKIIQENDTKIDFWQSESDHGIYDAMNKGICRITGDWVIFMNAGDVFSSEDTLENALRNAPRNADVVYGNYRIDYQTFQKIKKVPTNMQDIWKGMSWNHQSILVRRKCIQKFYFNTNYSLAADYEQLVRMFKAGKIFYHTDTWIADFADGGQSAKQKIKYLNQVREISKFHFPQIENIDFHFDRLVQKHQQIQKLKSILPNFIFEFLMMLKHKLL